MTTAVIIQSNYIPWKGCFDLIALSDVLIIYDDVQYTKRDWRNRNLIKTTQGTKWLTIPVTASGRFSQLINEVETNDDRWAKRHWLSITRAYGKAPAYKDYAETFEGIYSALAKERHLSVINRTFIDAICDMLGIKSDIRRSQDIVPASGQGKTQRLVELCHAVGASRYVSGPSAADYLETEAFEHAGIRLDFMDYADYRAYPQLHGEFIHNVSIIDLILNVGEDAKRYMKFSCEMP